MLEVLVGGSVGCAYGPIGLFFGRAEFVLQLHGHLRYFTAGSLNVVIAVIIYDVYGSGGCILLYKHSRSTASSRHHPQFRRLQLHHVSLRKVLLRRLRTNPHSTHHFIPFHKLVTL